MCYLRFVTYFFSSFSSLGSKHPENEDRSLCAPELGLFAVADGMSGASGGSLASEMAVCALREYLTASFEEMSQFSLDLLKEAFQAVNFAIFQQSLREPEFIGMGTTLTAALIWNEKALIAHVGDSRCYLYRNGKSLALTTDHVVSSVSEMSDRKQRRILSRCVGLIDNLEVDTQQIELCSGDLFLICSDGVSDWVTEKDLDRVICHNRERDGGPEQMARELVQLSKLRGTDDDASVVIFGKP